MTTFLVKCLSAFWSRLRAAFSLSSGPSRAATAEPHRVRFFIEDTEITPEMMAAYKAKSNQ